MTIHRKTHRGRAPSKSPKKKHQVIVIHDLPEEDRHAADDAAAAGFRSLIERRLFSSRTTQRIDLSVVSDGTAAVRFHFFPRQVLAHVSLGNHLRELWLTNHRIDSLPPEIAVLSRLRVLGLGGNALSVLPDELSSLDSLEVLHLERNALITIPASVHFPARLRELRLDHNALATMPPQITQLRLLLHLGLSHNRLTSLPPQVRRLQNLVSLDLDHNQIGPGLPTDEMTALRRLERLGLEGNRLQEPPDCLKRMPNLTYVRLSGNRFSTTPIARRRDGYYQLATHCDDEGNGSRTVAIDGLVPCRDQNQLNTLYYLKGQ
ncbi:hypothetical protein P43SY_007508 [Pythium insidiosum]|uniref:Leucine-rich repeat domain-containing protein n=1 Tax=Pythium insidiosum TaxID=114742 RepID=A0AAD5LLZ6_PYTIN|nr:hypothetical protein P43SY_007508 [Pythium insidiosum]KAJ0410116.1 hypothetical protein ATCC90586_001601 [Pythium insidiosum]